MIKIHFEDHGQDFLWWLVDENGIVAEAGPFQHSIWQGYEVYMPEKLRKGSKVIFRKADADPLELRYRVAKIEKNYVPNRPTAN